MSLTCSEPPDAGTYYVALIVPGPKALVRRARAILRNPKGEAVIDYGRSPQVFAELTIAEIQEVCAESHIEGDLLVLGPDNLVVYSGPVEDAPNLLRTRRNH